MISIKKLLREIGILPPLNEIGTANLYHFTSYSSLHGILKCDCFKLQDMNDEPDIEKSMIPSKYRYYMSTTRDKSLTAWLNSDSLGVANPVRIELDGQKLSTRFKIKPFDYWYHRFDAGGDYSIDRREYESPRYSKYAKTYDKNDEMEDRIFSSGDGSIKNASSYIRAVDVYYSPRVIEFSIRNNSVIFEIFADLLRMGIQTYIYDETNEPINVNLFDAFKKMDRKKATKLTSRFLEKVASDSRRFDVSSVP